MPDRHRVPLVDAAGRRSGALLALLCAVQVVVALSLGATHPALLLGVAAVVQLTLAVLLLRRSRRGPDERSLWLRLALGHMLVAGAAPVAAVLATAGAGATTAALPLVLAHVAAFPLVYGGMVLWNRDASNVADPSDTLLGVAAVLAAVAVTDTVLGRVSSVLSTEPWWQLQPVLVLVAAGLVLVGTATTVPFISGMHRDPRSRWLLAAVTAELVAGSAVATGHPEGWAVAAVGVACTAVAALMRPASIPRTRTDPATTTIGAFVVLSVSTVVLVIAAVGWPTPAAAWAAGVAAAGAGVRLLLNVRDLAQLTVSQHEALTDELTGLANRRAVLRRLDELAAADRPVLFALLDLDKFKEVNDGLGHSAGDDLLRQVGLRLRAAVASAELVGRLGGDEFAVVTTTGGPATADRAAALGRLLRATLAAPFPVGGMAVHVNASVGVTWCSPGAAGSPRTARSALLRQADAAMYDAKHTGDGFVVHDRDRHADSSGHLALVEELRTALSRGELVLHHQPQVDVTTGRAVGVESLLRWQHPQRGLLGPAEFLPLAEVHGLMGAVTDEVLRQAVAQAAAWHRAGRELRVSVNLSASNLLDTALPDRVAALLRAHDVPPAALVLEVTETVLMSDAERSLAVVRALADLGATVSIDDFGTGWASLTYLRQLPVGELKLDRTFTAELLTDPRVASIVAGTVDLAHRLGLRVVAEGVEDLATLGHLRVLQCDESQGYLHSPALPADELEEWLRVRGALVRAHS
ncbi:putative bifunctional diguanylate cyclase/phosphodiesterase [Modestobacter roseus]|uniref:Diguanylate cyclase/phosphodiesterase n=1 Tax=Modestobacter roseus TaxID=1181884 RepID=A0A562IMK5_9ACTN|nr:bifunctional diguanylate cyclase/phosphodiesterase [Modestobacter roseus]MQA32486.1 EAL domain-containing protein [Modestobacter roseus]TWH72247.1 diguanylate cyclase/phosphodiesterase [Modestobacter roseus]